MILILVTSLFVISFFKQRRLILFYLYGRTLVCYDNAKQPNIQLEEKLPENQILNNFLQIENGSLRISILQLIRL